MKIPFLLIALYLIVFGGPEISGKIDPVLNFQTKDTLTPDSTDVARFYAKYRFKRVWIDNSLRLNRTGDRFLKLLKDARNFGLEPEDYKVSEIESLLNGLNSSLESAFKTDTLLTTVYFLFARHLCCGKVQDPSVFTALKIKEDQTDYPEMLLHALQNNRVIEVLLAQQPENLEYLKLQAVLKNWLRNRELSDKKVNVTSNLQDSLQTSRMGKEALKLHGYLGAEDSDQDFMDALKQFQYEHGLEPDGIIGKRTARALSKSTWDYYKQAALSLERWRWKQDWVQSFLYVNIPAYTLKYYRNNHIEKVLKVVVGTPKRQTPEVYSKIEYLMVFPYWNVPRSISVGEILVHAKKDPAYLLRNRYEVFDRYLQPVDPMAVRWDTLNARNFDFYIRQKGGRINALGMVKFMFPNKYSVYLHDTPYKNLFKKSYRARSHGCVRVEQALELAGNLLRNDQNVYNTDSIQAIIRRKVQTKIILNDKVPVYIQYITCDVDENGNLLWYPDVYRRDENLQEILFSDRTMR